MIVPLFLKDALGDGLFFVVNDRCVALVNVDRHVDVALISQSRVYISVQSVVIFFVDRDILITPLFLGWPF